MSLTRFINPSWNFSFINVNFVNPIHESDKLRSTSTFQSSSIRFSSNTFGFAGSVIYFTSIGKVSSFDTENWTRDSTWWRVMKSQKSVRHRHPLLGLLTETSPNFSEDLSWNREFLQISVVFQWILRCPTLSPKQLFCIICDLTFQKSIILQRNYLL